MFSSILIRNTKNLKNLLLIMLASLSLTACNDHSTKKEAQLKLQKWIINNMQKYHIVGASVAVIKDYHIVWSKGFGYRNKALQEPVTTQTLFNAASISKPITAIAVLLAFHDIHLSLNANINTLLTQWKIPPNPYTRNHPVTMSLLLEHSAGITGFRCKGYIPTAKLPSFIQVLNGKSPANTPPVTVNWQPGSKYMYSPAGYMIIQAVLMDTYHQSFPVVMNNLVLSPLGMTRSTFGLRLPEKYLKNIALPYLPSGKRMPNAPLIFMAQAAGGLWTTPNDLAKFIIAIQYALAGQPNTVLSKQLVRTLLTPGISNNMGKGIEVNLNRYGQEKKIGTYFGHSGWNSGYLGLILGSESGGNGVVILINTAPYMTFKGQVTQNNFIKDLVIQIANEQHWRD